MIVIVVINNLIIKKTKKNDSAPSCHRGSMAYPMTVKSRYCVPLGIV